MVQLRPKQLNKFRRDAWLDINLANLEFNLNYIYKNCGQKNLIPVLKADAYGHGASVLAKVLDAYDFVEAYAVASVDEAIELRKASSKSIMVLGVSPKWSYDAALENEIELTLCSLSEAHALNEFLLARNKNLNVHLKFDTGMNRIGFKFSDTNEAAQMIKEIEELSQLNLVSIFSHFSDPKDETYTREQIELFESWTKTTKVKKHIASSTAARNIPESRFDFVRCGIELYGLENPELKPLVSLYARVSHVKTIKAAEYLSYKRTWQAPKDMKILTLPLGYADGVPRIASNQLKAFANKKYLDQVGLITMDQMMLADEIGSEIKEGDLVELIGEHCPIASWAELAQTISYEILTNLNLRLPKTYSR